MINIYDKENEVIVNMKYDKLDKIKMLLRNDSESTIDSLIKNLEKNNNENINLLNETNTINFEKKKNENEKMILNLPKNTNQTRLNYYTKLINNGVWYKNNIKQTFNSLFIFDWDDTLFCTSEISINNLLDENYIIPKEKKIKFLKLENEVKKVLQNCIEKGKTYIITNSEPGWVQFSSKKFLPSIVGLLDKINIISARGLYENKYPYDSFMWKINAFNDIVSLYDHTLLSNIICIGDSFLEIKAGKNLSNKFTNAFIKTIKFKENPSIDELIMEIRLVNNKFLYIYSAVKNWTINVKRKI
jgi:hypothetical protein